MNEGLKRTDDVVGTSLQGHVWATLNQLTEKLGPPHYGEDESDKSTALWQFKTPLGVVFTVYDYDDLEMRGTDGVVYRWHIGGANLAALAQFEAFTGMVAERFTANRSRPNILRGQRVWWKPEWAEDGDESLVFIAVEDSADERGERPTIDIGVTAHYHWFAMPRQRVAVNRLTTTPPRAAA